MKLIDLKESITDVVYHVAPIENMVGILKSNEFQLSRQYSAELPAKYQGRATFFYMSLARSRRSHFISNFVESFPSGLFIIDGRKLAHRYRGTAIDYFSGTSMFRTDEMEDRIFSYEPTIPRFMDYVLGVDFAIIEEEVYNNSRLVYYFKQGIELALRHNVPVRVFTSYKNFYDGRKGFETGREWLNRFEEVIGREVRSPRPSDAQKRLRKDQIRKSEKTVDVVINMYYAETLSELDDEAIAYVKFDQSGVLGENIERALANLPHDNVSLKALLRIMKRENVHPRRVTKFASELINKFKRA